MHRYDWSESSLILEVFTRHHGRIALVAKGAERFLKVTRTVELKHEEHTRIELPAGKYRVVQQVEYTPLGLRNVAD